MHTQKEVQLRVAKTPTHSITDPLGDNTRHPMNRRSYCKKSRNGRRVCYYFHQISDHGYLYKHLKLYEITMFPTGSSAYYQILSPLWKR